MSGRRYLLFAAVLVAVICVDQASKMWVLQHFALYESREIIPGLFNLTFLTNNGGAFSLLAGQPALWRQLFFVTATLIALGFIWAAHRSYGPRGPLYTLSLSLIAGGAIGNLIDRLRFSCVIDFLDVYVGDHHWPAFNAADSAITIGVLLFLLKNLLLDTGQDHKTPSTSV